MKIEIRNTEILLLPEKAIFFLNEKTLVLADMHLGKMVHFRRRGFFVPNRKINEDLEEMLHLISKYQPLEVVFLGDLFHSEINSEIYQFLKIIDLLPHIRFTLTIGNHDVIPESFFSGSKLNLVDEIKLKHDIVLRHHYPQTLSPTAFYIIGHIHPGYVIYGKGRQTFRFPIFHLSTQSLTLPAFGKHTGLYIPAISSRDLVYLIMNEEVVLITK